jgi:hypothetical protein
LALLSAAQNFITQIIFLFSLSFAFLKKVGKSKRRFSHFYPTAAQKVRFFPVIVWTG